MTFITTSDLPRRPFTESAVSGLHVVEWPGDGPAVVALHGLSASVGAWLAVADAMPDQRIVAIDARGRGGSPSVPGVGGLRAHARDAAAVVRKLGLTDVVVVGHSMGAFVAPLLAQELGADIARIVCLDGGIPPALPRILGPRLVRETFRIQLRRVDRTHPTVAAYAARSRLAPTLVDYPELRPAILRMLESELVGADGAVHPMLDRARALDDAVDTFFGADLPAALDALTVPADVLLADHQIKSTDRPFVSDAAVATWTARQPLLRPHRVAGNHVTLLFSSELVDAISGTR